MMRVLAVASGGGHWVQLLRLRDAFCDLDVAYVSVDAGYRGDVPEHRFHVVRNVTRWDRWGHVTLIVQLTRILLAERPQAIITTGAAPGFFALALGKTLLRARTLWIDSIANTEQLSMSGHYARHFADVCLTQWPELSGHSGPQYWGAVL